MRLYDPGVATPQTSDSFIVRFSELTDGSETRPRVENILDRACDELKPALRPEQQEELEVIRAEALERLRTRGGA